MDRPLAREPEPLYDKPHAVDLAQVLMVFQYFMLMSVSFGFGPRIFNWVKGQTADVPVLSDIEGAIDIGTGYPIAVVAPVFVVYTIPYVAVVLNLGHGRRWARIAALLVVPLNTVIGIVGVGRTYGEILGLVSAVLWLTVAVCVLGGLASPKARRWFRQGGWAPWYHRYEMDQAARRRPISPGGRRRIPAGDEDSAD
ncbi:hypothetical protein LO763_26750 [Glycomyces sp. A-F 0318]|uniref:hypothetical protein n=1 Tax=Glycomyces amatae TaxID=2881355 RepID=UPI001E60A3FC|nr:hypothetical protein [Glycomyces amatae]MCD0447220.1 hypothetical protein [Glycomyces amatae]